MTNKPNFKVKHPYSYLFKSIMLGLMMLILGIFAVNISSYINKSDPKAPSNVDASYDVDGTKDSDVAGSGTKSSPYQIGSWQDLWEMCYIHSEQGPDGFFTLKYYVLTKDIVVSDYIYLHETTYRSNQIPYFYGVLDGNGHKITKSILINNYTSLLSYYYNYLDDPLFGRVLSGSVISNVNVRVE